jgi:hypothetical protein
MLPRRGFIVKSWRVTNLPGGKDDFTQPSKGDKMSSSTANGAASDSDIISKGLTSAKFDGAAITAFWQSGATRWMRSSEILMRGMAEVARLEGELGRNLLQVAMAGMKTPSFAGKPEERARDQLGTATHEFAGFVTSLRKITEESRKSCKDATLALFEAGSPAAHPSEPVVPHTAEPLTKGKPAPTPSALARAAE